MLLEARLSLLLHSGEPLDLECHRFTGCDWARCCYKPPVLDKWLISCVLHALLRVRYMWASPTCL